MGDEQPKTVTAHTAAAKAIDALRDVAATLKLLGDENLRLEEQVEELGETVNDLEGEAALAAEGAAAELEDWHIAIEDHERGIIDTAELYAKTIRA